MSGDIYLKSLSIGALNVYYRTHKTNQSSNKDMQAFNIRQLVLMKGFYFGKLTKKEQSYTFFFLFWFTFEGHEITLNACLDAVAEWKFATLFKM